MSQKHEAPETIPRAPAPRGEGQVIPRAGDKFLLRVYLGERRDPATGRRRRVYSSETFEGTEAAARRRMRKLLAERDEGDLVAPSKMTLDGLLDAWLAHTRRQVQRQTADDYEMKLRLYVRPRLGPLPLASITFEELEEHYDHLTGEAGFSGRTARYAHVLLRSAFKYAVKKKWIRHSPAVYADAPGRVRHEFEVLSETEAPRFIEAAAADKYGALFILALTTGLRPEEYLALRLDCLHLDRGLVSVQRTMLRFKGGWEFGRPKTAKSRRLVKVPPPAVRALTAHLKRRRELAFRAGPAYEQHELVFANDVGAPLTTRSLVRRHYRPIMERAGVTKHLRLYDLRHSYATLALLAGIHPKVVSEALGHASVAFTMDTYAHVLPTMQERAAQQMADLLFGGRADWWEAAFWEGSNEFAHISRTGADGAASGSP